MCNKNTHNFVKSIEGMLWRRRTSQARITRITFRFFRVSYERRRLTEVRKKLQKQKSCKTNEILTLRTNPDLIYDLNNVYNVPLTSNSDQGNSRYDQETPNYDDDGLKTIFRRVFLPTGSIYAPSGSDLRSTRSPTGSRT